MYYPQVSKELDEIANRNADSRVELGVHFPSDVEAGRLLAKELMNRFDKSQLPEKNLIEETLNTDSLKTLKTRQNKSPRIAKSFIMQHSTGEYEAAIEMIRKLFARDTEL